jgi:hypothetical protein
MKIPDYLLLKIAYVLALAILFNSFIVSSVYMHCSCDMSCPLMCYQNIYLVLLMETALF